MLKEHDPVILIEDLSGQTLFDDALSLGVVPAGTFGYIVGVYNNGSRFDVEFFDQQGETLAVTDVRADQVRAASQQDIAARRIPA